MFIKLIGIEKKSGKQQERFISVNGIDDVILLGDNSVLIRRENKPDLEMQLENYDEVIKGITMTGETVNIDSDFIETGVSLADYSTNTKAELEEILKSRGVEFIPNQNKDYLLKMVEESNG